MGHNLIELKKIIPNIRLDIRYATTNNFTGKILDSVPKAYLINEAANGLLKANEEFRLHGLGILVWDAYRPLSVTKILWDRTPPKLHEYVANPVKGSMHNRGCAVDMTLYNLRSGELLEMPSDFDEFDDRARMSYMPTNILELNNRMILVEIMSKNGFTVYEDEWWHFNWDGFKKYPELDIPIQELL